MSLLGLDIGTSATKGILLDERGRVLATARRGYRTRMPAPDRSELSADRVWTAVRSVIAELARIGRDTGSPVRGVCAGGSGDEVVAVDARGRPIGPVIMAADRRSETEARAIETVCGVEDLFLRTGLTDIGATPVARYRWMERHEPRVSQVARLLSWPEWVASRLGLPPTSDPTMAARSLGWDVLAGAYADIGCPATALPEGMLSPVVATGTLLDRIPAATCGALGLAPGATYVVGGFDQAMATLGAGAIEPGMGHDGSGSWEALSIRLETRVIDGRLRRRGWSVGPGASGGAPLEAMATWGGGLVLAWAGGLATGTTADGRGLETVVERLPAGRPRLLAPVGLAEPGAGPLGGMGAIVGLDLATTHADLVLAVIDGLAHRLRRAVREVVATGVPVHTIRCTGGGTRSRRWLQAKADATGLVIERPAVDEAGALAAALLAGSAIGALPPVEEAVRELVRVTERFEPDPTAAAWHDERAGLYARMAGTLDDLAGPVRAGRAVSRGRRGAPAIRRPRARMTR
jgi:xylulokinase